MPESLSRSTWANSKACGAWLEHRYPLGDASLGSPLYRYMRVAWEHESYNIGTGLNLVAIGDTLSFGETDKENITLE